MAEKQILDWHAHGEYVIELAKTKSCTQIAQEFDVTSDLIRRWLWRRGISAVNHMATITPKPKSDNKHTIQESVKNAPVVWPKTVKVQVMQRDPRYDQWREDYNPKKHGGASEPAPARAFKQH